MITPFPFLTEDLPGTGGRIRGRVEDFVVEEIPLYEPVGAGEHIYVRIQKSGVSTHEAIRRLARAVGVPPRVVGYAGLKDSRAIARQTLSFPEGSESRLATANVYGIDVLEVKRHGNKLRIGHLKGNRFLIRVRDVTADAEHRTRAVLDVLVRRGAPNSYGSQRFGSKGDSYLVGRRILLDDPQGAVDALLGRPSERERDPGLRSARHLYEAGDHKGALRAAMPRPFTAERRVLDALVRGKSAVQALRSIPKGIFRLLVCSYQSWLFNKIVRDRMPDLGTLQPGDLAYLHDRGAVFRVDTPEEEQTRADELEISPSAPMYGTKTTLAGGEPGERERALLAEEGVNLSDFSLPGLRLKGERRPMRIPITDPTVRPEGEDVILLAFSLPKGAYATTILREVMKVDEPGLPE